MEKTNSYTDEDLTATPWCYMPPEMHFNSPTEMKKAFWMFHLSRIQEELRGEVPMNFLPTPGKFEKIRRKDGKYMLLPTFIDYGFLFRGQQKFYSPCVPTLYRKKASAQEMLLEKLRCIEFELYLKQLPQVEDFEKWNYYIDYTGLCQHYGMKTDVIDLTNSLDVALFFAMCNMDEHNHYQPKRENREYIGYIYVVPTLTFEGNSDIHSLFDDKISAIGMQPFSRPGAQRGFSIHMKPGEELKSLLYSFSYTKEDSERVWKEFGNGRTLWDDDAVSAVADVIKGTKAFTYRALNLCKKRYKEELLSYRSDLIGMGCKFAKKQIWTLSDREKARLRGEYQKAGGLSGTNEIVARKIFDGGKICSCRDSKSLLAEMMSRFVFSGCPAPEGYDSDLYFVQSNDGKIWGLQKKTMSGIIQCKPNATTGKIDKWTGDWHSLKIDYNRDNPLKMEVVKVKK